MRRIKYIVPLLAVLVVSMTAVGQNDPRDEIAQAKAELMKAKQDFQQGMNEQMDEIEADVANLQQSVESVSAEVRTDIRIQIAKLEKDREYLDWKLDKISDATEDEFEAMKPDIQAFVDRIGKETDEAIQDIKDLISKGEETKGEQEQGQDKEE